MKESIGDQILKKLFEPRFRYKGMPVNMFGLPSFSGKYSRDSFYKQLSRYEKSGFVEKDDEFLRITKRGREFIKRKQESLSQFNNMFSKSAPKNLLVMFDIPESQKAEREWFRWHLKKFNYEMIQKSVWVGPSPLPEDFLKYLKEIKLKDCIKTFKLAKPYKETKE